MKNALIAVIMITLIILSALYVYYGNNWLAEQQFLQKRKNSEFVRNEFMANLLEIEQQSQELLDEISQLSYKIEIFPHKAIKLKDDVKIEFDSSISLKPIFDHHNIYVVLDNKLIAYNKKSYRERWNKEFPADIIDLVLLDVNRLLVIVKSNEIICLGRETGSEKWRREGEYSAPNATRKNAYQISLDKYKRLDNSVILSIEKKRLLVLNNISGEIICEYNSDTEINHVSDFDLLTKSIYIVNDNIFRKLELLINSR